MTKREIERIQKMKAEARKKADQLKEQEKQGRKRNTYDKAELKEQWEKLNHPVTLLKSDAVFLKEKFYSSYPVTVNAIYAQIYKWTHENAKKQGTEVIMQRKRKTKKESSNG